MKNIFIIFILGGALFANNLERGIEEYKNGNIPQALHFLQKACNQKIESSCVGALKIYADGQGNRKNGIKFFNLISEKCTRNDFFYCMAESVAYYEGTYMSPKNLEKSTKLSIKACDGGMGRACYSLGGSYLYGHGNTVINYLKARDYYKKGCDFNEAASCDRLGDMYNDGKGLRQNKSIAKELYGIGCDLGYKHSCESYKELNEMGIKERNSATKILNYFD